MKLCWKLHATAELHTDLTADAAEDALRPALGTQFHGGQTGDTWKLSRRDRNVFRPSVQLNMQPDGEGTQLLVQYRLDKTLLIFMCVWTVLVIGFSLCNNVYLIATLLLFWGALLVGFSHGVNQAEQTLMTLFGAYKIEN